MPYKSDAQRRFFNANRSKLEAQGVDVDEWNDSSRGMKLPERAKKKKTEKSAVAVLAKLAADPISATLQNLLFNSIDLALLFKHCHWNVKGKLFGPVHKFLDEVYETLVESSDDIAERMVALDYPASALSSDMSKQTEMAELPVKFMPFEQVIDDLTTRLTKLTELYNAAIKSTDSDAVTSNMLQDMTHKLEKHLWMLKSQKEYSAETKQAESEYTEAPTRTQANMAQLGGFAAQAGLGVGTQAYATKAVGKPDYRWTVGLRPQDIIDLSKGKPISHPQLAGRKITDAWFDKEHLEPGFKYLMEPKPYSDERLGNYRKLMKLFGSDAPKVSPYTPGTPAAYNPANHVVYANPGIADDAGHILAHELGHARQRKLLNTKAFGVARRAGSLASAYGGLMPFFRKDPENARNDALIGTAGMAPTLGIEFDASLRGSNLMKRLAQQEGTWSKMNMLSKLKHRLGAFRGLPTYLAAASLPLATYGSINALGGYNRKPAIQNQVKDMVDKARSVTLGDLPWISGR